MKALKNIRLKTGLTQNDLSDLLGVTRSHLAQAEAGNRKLNGNALLGVAHLETNFKKMAKLSVSDPEESGTKQNEYLACLKENNAIRIMLAKKKIKRMEKIYEQAQKAKMLYTYFKDNNLHDDNAMLERKIHGLNKKILETGMFQQEQMRTQLQLLTAVEGHICDCLAKLEGIQYPTIT